jgi:hypothetical protein
MSLIDVHDPAARMPGHFTSPIVIKKSAFSHICSEMRIASNR